VPSMSRIATPILTRSRAACAGARVAGRRLAQLARSRLLAGRDADDFHIDELRIARYRVIAWSATRIGRAEPARMTRLTP
jgi:hypothetical protein